MQPLRQSPNTDAASIDPKPTPHSQQSSFSISAGFRYDSPRKLSITPQPFLQDRPQS